MPLNVEAFYMAITKNEDVMKNSIKLNDQNFIKICNIVHASLDLNFV